MKLSVQPVLVIALILCGVGGAAGLLLDSMQEADERAQVEGEARRRRSSLSGRIAGTATRCRMLDRDALAALLAPPTFQSALSSWREERVQLTQAIAEYHAISSEPADLEFVAQCSRLAQDYDREFGHDLRSQKAELETNWPQRVRDGSSSMLTLLEAASKHASVEALADTPSTAAAGGMLKVAWAILATGLLAAAAWSLNYRRILRRSIRSLRGATQAIARLESDWQIDESGDIEFDEVSDAVEDVSQKMHELQDSLSKALEEGQGYALAKENLLTGMSHEMRTPMNCVIGMSSLLLEGTLDSNQRNQALAIQSSGRQLLGLIDDVLHLAQLESRTVELEQRSFALLPAVGSVLDTFRSRAEQKDIEFSINLESGAPECVSGDQLRLQQILTNVLDNAIAFTPKGQISVYMTSERFGTDEVWIRFEIRDTGSGIPREAHKRIFETFEQADMTPTRRHGGAGLGLSISKRLVELMEGEIGFDSSPGEGTRLHFSVILKLPPGQSHRLESQPLDDVAPALPVSSSEEAEPRPRVLVVEHDEINQRIMRSILSQLGCDVVLAETGFDGIDLVRRDTYALIFMECLMPVMDGYQATRAIRSGAGTQRRVPIIALTASDLRGASKACLAAGMNDVIAKPIGREAVARVLRRWSRDPLPSALPSDF